MFSNNWFSLKSYEVLKDKVFDDFIDWNFLLALEVILNVTHYFFMKIPNKKELKQKASVHLSYIDFKEIMKFYKDYTKELYSF